MMNNQFEVPERGGRIAVSVELAYQHPEFDYWTYCEESAEMGLDPWRYIDCDLDKLTDSPKYLLFGREVFRGHLVYMQLPKP